MTTGVTQHGTISYISKPAHANAFRRGRAGNSVRSIIIHSSCGHIGGDLPTLMGEDPEHLVSSHWYVAKDGTYYHIVDNSDTAYHAGVVCDNKYSNVCSIGIEQEHVDGEESWPDVQVAATAKLCVALALRYPGAAIMHHSQVATFTMGGRDFGRKTDPVDFPSDVFWDAYKIAAAFKWDFSAIGG